MAINITDTSLLRLMQLVSTNLPVGGFSFSQGLESACELGWVKNQAAIEQWLALQIEQSLACLDVPILFKIYRALDEQDNLSLLDWNVILLAHRETHELYLSDVAMGQALRRLLLSLEVPCLLKNPCSFVAMFAIVAHYWQIKQDVAALGFCWSWLDNQIAAATKLVPLGQTQAQQLMGVLQPLIPKAIETAKNLPEDQIGASLPALSIASSLHEHQYSRLFRS